MRKMSWMMDWKWMKYEYSEEAVGDVWGGCGMCGGGYGRCVEETVGDVCGRCVDVLDKLKYVQYT